MNGLLSEFLEWLFRHRGKVAGTLVGLLLGWMFVAYGVFKTLFIAACIIGGYIVGTWLDVRVRPAGGALPAGGVSGAAGIAAAMPVRLAARPAPMRERSLEGRFGSVVSRRLAREVAVRTLFQVDVGRANVDRAFEYSLEGYDLEERDVLFARGLVDGVLAHLDEIDAVISRSADHWSIDRMAKTDRNILRIAVYEIRHADDVPASVAVNEAVELAKRYGDADSGKFVNGVLGFVLRGASST